jgi:LuxR family maltose regulon positive regulatory protein
MIHARATLEMKAASGGLPEIALAKMAPPSANRLRVERGRLLDLLQTSETRRLILLKAPAGYGKTTLAVDWCEQLRRSSSIVAWLSVDEDDNEPSAFAYHITKTIQRAAPALAESAIGLLTETKLIAPRNVLSATINAVAESDDEVYLFLDDYHAITDSRSHELTAYLLRYAPSNFHLVIMSRTEPPLPISRLRLMEELAEIDVTSLRFTLDETRQFLSAEQAPHLAPADLAKLHEATEGWPAALQLARISLRNSPDPSKTVRSLSGASRKISAYIEDTLATQADEIVQFLLQTAILDRLHGSLCQAVTGIARSSELLRALNHEQFLVMALDEENGWYRYHHLMSDFLLDRLQTRVADQIPELHRRAYRWYASCEMWNHAVQHAISAKDYDQALSYVEHCAMSLIAKGDFLTLVAWQRQFPPELMSSQVDIKLAVTWGMSLVLRFDQANALLTQVETFAQAINQVRSGGNAGLAAPLGMPYRTTARADPCLRSNAYPTDPTTTFSSFTACGTSCATGTSRPATGGRSMPSQSQNLKWMKTPTCSPKTSGFIFTAWPPLINCKSTRPWHCMQKPARWPRNTWVPSPFPRPSSRG